MTVTLFYTYQAKDDNLPIFGKTWTDIPSDLAARYIPNYFQLALKTHLMREHGYRDGDGSVIQLQRVELSF